MGCKCRIGGHDFNLCAGPYIKIQFHAFDGGLGCRSILGACIQAFSGPSRGDNHFSCAVGLRCVHLVSDINKVCDKLCNHETAEPGACDYTIFPDYKVLPVGLLWNALPIWTMPSFLHFLQEGALEW